MKNCSNINCNQINPQSSDRFTRSKRNRNGLSSWCKKCSAANSKSWREANPEKYKAISTICIKNWRMNNEEYYKEKNRINAKAYSKANLDKVRITHKAWRNANPDKQKKIAQRSLKNNRGKFNARIAKRKTDKVLRTPKWLTKEQLLEIQQFYIEAKELSWLSESPLEVDHIVPLRGKNVSGLHVPWNLQILPKSLNAKKGNNFND
jgi:hypothetical protein